MSEPQEVNLKNNISSFHVTDDREARSKFWIAAYTRPRSEKKTAKALNKLGVETYLPIQKQIRQWSDRRKSIEVPIIPMIVFARIQNEDVPIISSNSLIIKILSFPGYKTPAIIKEHEIENLRQLLSQSEIPAIFEFESFKSSEQVIITQGKLKGVTGLVKEVDRHTTRIWISVNILGGAIIRVENSDIERIQ